MKPPPHRGLPFAATLVLAITIVACSDRSDDTTASSSSETTSSRAAGSGRELKDSARQGVESARSKLGEAGQAS
ncbi:MAG: hypothetical protein ACJ8GO_05205, partial [Ramlibacter sp.]